MRIERVLCDICGKETSEGNAFYFTMENMADYRHVDDNLANAIGYQYQYDICVPCMRAIVVLSYRKKGIATKVRIPNQEKGEDDENPSS